MTDRAEQNVKTVADQFVETLAIAGVKRIYGIVGDSLNGLTDAIRRQPQWLAENIESLRSQTEKNSA
jgi:thiamine pyrophosphate-dependent acetolactate synthase large subunit-like protein